MCSGLAVVIGEVWIGGCSNWCVVRLFLFVWCLCLVPGSKLSWSSRLEVKISGVWSGGSGGFGGGFGLFIGLARPLARVLLGGRGCLIC